MSAGAIEASLEAVAAKVGDPVPLVYARLFADHPDMRALFALDTDDAVKGNMLAQLIECLMDLAGDRHFAEGLIRTEVINHDNIGVPPEVFASFLETVIATFREALGTDWTAEYDAAWAVLGREFTSLLAAEEV